MVNCFQEVLELLVLIGQSADDPAQSFLFANKHLKNNFLIT